MNDYPTESEINNAANVLRRLPKGFLPFAIFSVLAEKVVLPCVELSIFRDNNGTLEILLTQREEDDKYWPGGAWHLPGGVLRATDKEDDFSSIFKRTLEGELSGEHTLLYEPRFGAIRFQETNRGRELVVEYFSEVSYGDVPPKEGRFFPIDALPEAIMKQYHILIPEVVKAFLSRS